MQFSDGLQARLIGTAGGWGNLGGWRDWRTHLGAPNCRAGGFGAGGAASSAGLK